MTKFEYIDAFVRNDIKQEEIKNELKILNEKYIKENSKFKVHDIIDVYSTQWNQIECSIRISTIDVVVFKNSKDANRIHDCVISLRYFGSPVLYDKDRKIVHYRSGYGASFYDESTFRQELRLSELNNYEFVK